MSGGISFVGNLVKSTTTRKAARGFQCGLAGALRMAEAGKTSGGPVGASESPQMSQKAGNKRHVGSTAFLVVIFDVFVLERTNLWSVTARRFLP